jgi:hypothetical protein
MSQIQKKLFNLHPTNGLTDAQLKYLTAKIKRTINKSTKHKVEIKGSTILIDNTYQLWVSMERKLAVGTVNGGKMYHFSNPAFTVSRLYEMMSSIQLHK